MPLITCSIGGIFFKTPFTVICRNRTPLLHCSQTDAQKRSASLRLSHGPEKNISLWPIRGASRPAKPPPRERDPNSSPLEIKNRLHSAPRLSLSAAGSRHAGCCGAGTRFEVIWLEPVCFTLEKVVSICLWLLDVGT
jgi:hypothetical protein